MLFLIPSQILHLLVPRFAQELADFLVAEAEDLVLVVAAGVGEARDYRFRLI